MPWLDQFRMHPPSRWPRCLSVDPWLPHHVSCMIYVGVTSMELAGIPVGSARQSLVDVAYVALRDAITSGTLVPGARLREAALAKHFSVSTTPIREALRRLDREGLVRLAPNRGAVV